MGTKNAFWAPSVKTAKEARTAWMELDAQYRSYEAELDNLLDQAEADNEAISAFRNFSGQLGHWGRRGWKRPYRP